MGTSSRTASGMLLFPGQVAAPDGPVDMTIMYAMHHAFRRDLAAFAEAVAGTPIGDGATWRALHDRWRWFARFLHAHHTGEDSGLWPVLLEKVDQAGDAAGRAVLEAMEAEHAEIDPLLEACGEGFARLAGRPNDDVRAALEVRLVAARERLGRHLDHEERDALAIMQRHVTQADWLKIDAEHFKPHFPPRVMLAAIPWIMHGLSADAQRACVRSGGGTVVGLVWRLFLRRPFARRERAAFRHR